MTILEDDRLIFLHTHARFIVGPTRNQVIPHRHWKVQCNVIQLSALEGPVEKERVVSK